MPLINRLLRSKRDKRISVLSAILAEGEATGVEKRKAEDKLKWRIEVVRDFLLRNGSKRFSTPDEQTQATIEAITYVDEWEARNWQEFLQ